MSRILFFQAWILFLSWNFAYSSNNLPIITSVTVSAPGTGMSGYVGCKVIIRGIYLSDTKFVRINKAVVSDFIIESDNCITFKAIAVSGIISIQTNTGTGAYFGSEYVNLGYCLPGNAYAVKGGGKICEKNIDIELANSQNGFNYQLFLDGVDTGLSIKGTGMPIRFKNLTKPGKYTVTSVNTKCEIKSEMSGYALIENDKGTIIYLDADNDSYGSTASSKIWCEPRMPEGYVSNDGDCDDSNAAISPKAVEIFDNGIDDNCDGLIDKMPNPNSAVKRKSRNSEMAKSSSTKATCYPNPFDVAFTIDVYPVQGLTIKVYNVLGKLLDKVDVAASQERNIFELGSNYPSGVYKVIMVSDNDSEVFQIIKR